MTRQAAHNSFQDFVSYFPPAELPLTVQYNDLHSYAKTNDPLPDTFLADYLLPYLDFEVDEFTEFLPCFQIYGTEQNIQLVFWTGRLMHYAFYLITYEKSGRFVDLAEIAGFYSDRQEVFQRMAHLNEDSEVYIVETNLSTNEKQIVTDQTKKWVLNILPDGHIQKMQIESI
ncbi:MAG: hypothetical protein IPM92_09360 [Saprospiraceae bacterium]|nr:hypothetical protein [Saprospiraceae bacterium]